MFVSRIFTAACANLQIWQVDAPRRRVRKAARKNVSGVAVASWQQLKAAHVLMALMAMVIVAQIAIFLDSASFWRNVL